MIRAIVVIFLLAFVPLTIGFGLAASRFQLASETSTTVTCVPDAEMREKIRTIMLEAIDQSLRDHIVRLHATWMKDETGQPARATTGARQGIKAYIGGRTNALKWNPVLC